MKRRSFEGKVTILKKKEEALKKTQMFISEDLSPGDLLLRKQLQPAIDKAKGNGDKWFFRSGKLFINGKAQ